MRTVRDYRQHAAKLLVREHRLTVRPGAFAADIENVGSLVRQPQPLRDSRLRIEKLPGIREAVGRDVDDPHQQRRPR